MRNTLAVVLTIFTVACARPVIAPTSDFRQPLSSSTLLNMEYELPEDVPSRVSLTDGKWFVEDSEGRRSLTIVDLDLRGDLDGDGVPDAVALLVYWGGGSGVFSYLAAVLNSNGGPRHVSSVELGDRVEIRSIRFKEGRITAKLVVTGEDDPACCPTKRVTEVFVFVNGRLVEKGDA